MCMIGDDHGWDMFHAETRRAAKEHRCCECGRTIAEGEHYKCATGLYDAHWSTYHQCEQCVAAIEWLLVACNGYLFEMTAEDLRSHVDGEEQYLRSAPLTRLVRWQEAKWRNRAGELRPVEDVKAVTSRAIAKYREMSAA